MTVFGLICAFVGLGVLAILAVQVLAWCTQRLWRWGKRRHASWIGWLRTAAEYVGLVEAEGTMSRCGSCMTVIYWGRDAHEPPEWTCPLCGSMTRCRLLASPSTSPAGVADPSHKSGETA